MTEFVGVHVAEDSIYISHTEGGQVLVDASPFLTGWEKEQILRDEACFQDAASRVDRYLRERCGIMEYEILLAVPDSFGLWEMLALQAMAKRCKIPLRRFMPESLAAALTLAASGRSDGFLQIAIPEGENLSVSEYNLGDGVAEKVGTYAAGTWVPGSPEGFAFLDDEARETFDCSAAQGVCVVGTPEQASLVQESFYMYRPHQDNERYYRRNRRFQMIASTAIAYGLALQGAVLMGKSCGDGLLALDTLSSYDLCISVNGEMYQGVLADTTIPTKIEVPAEEATGLKDGVEIVLFERRGLHFQKIGSSQAASEALSSLQDGRMYIGIDVDAGRRIRVALLSGNGREVAGFMVDEQWLQKKTDQEAAENKKTAEADSGKAETPEGIDYQEFIAIMDSLEYASRYAADENGPEVQGMKKIYQQALDILAKKGVEPIPALGEKFDYTIHNAVAQVADINLPSGTVKEVMQTGYRKKDGTVIRYASVIVVE